MDCAERRNILLGNCRDLVICVNGVGHVKDLVIGMLGSGISLFEVDFVGRDIQHFRSFVDGHCNVVAGAPVTE